jgi:hypothetical protein
MISLLGFAVCSVLIDVKLVADVDKGWLGGWVSWGVVRVGDSLLVFRADRGDVPLQRHFFVCFLQVL